ncbi:hypothetical protein [Chitinilyticum litopenaei]|uniref:hypothetical protein n=1 Tax=Chitinilyticum litopenaei TaxID=1121276 RepID=UPI00040FBE76|nr:hypothetical protein [Chitinilyticum litopenaei]
MGPVLALILGVAVVAGILLSAFDKRAEEAAAGPALTQVRGLIGSEKETFYRDPRVVAAFARLGLQVDVQKAGSREMAAHPELKRFDFGHPAGSPAALQLQQVARAQKTYTPFFTPMAVASWQKLLPVLEANKLVARRDNSYFIIDMQRLLGLIGSGTRWRELHGNTVYDSGRAVLISSTDVRKSNSAAMYLALASYVLNDGNVVHADDDIARLLPALTPLFLKQGFQEASSAGPFDDYTGMGMGKAPLVMVYESQFLEYQSRLPQPNPDMVLLYPLPTVFTKHVLVPFSEAGSRVGEALQHDAELQRLAAEYGYRGASPQHFTAFMQQKKLQAPATLVDVIDPPGFAAMEKLIDGIAQGLQ